MRAALRDTVRAVRAITKEDVRKVEGHLQKLGWPVISLAPGTWRSSFRGRTGAFPLVIQVDDGWCKLLVLLHFGSCMITTSLCSSVPW